LGSGIAGSERKTGSPGTDYSSIFFSSSGFWPVISQRTSEVGMRPVELKVSMNSFIRNLSPSWQAYGRSMIDPNFDPMRKNPRSQKLVAGGR
jgi:hypothetical protein